ncbi:MAG TPA: hypothetical protein VFF98_10640 [Novosphingobium sp.]|nr:hypothetical protein [Novosphingobium sp.]
MSAAADFAARARDEAAIAAAAAAQGLTLPAQCLPGIAANLAILADRARVLAEALAAEQEPGA